MVDLYDIFRIYILFSGIAQPFAFRYNYLIIDFLELAIWEY